MPPQLDSTTVMFLGTVGLFAVAFLSIREFIHIWNCKRKAKK